MSIDLSTYICLQTYAFGIWFGPVFVACLAHKDKESILLQLCVRLELAASTRRLGFLEGYVDTAALWTGESEGKGCLQSVAAISVFQRTQQPSHQILRWLHCWEECRWTHSITLGWYHANTTSELVSVAVGCEGLGEADSSCRRGSVITDDELRLGEFGPRGEFAKKLDLPCQGSWGKSIHGIYYQDFETLGVYTTCLLYANC